MEDDQFILYAVENDKYVNIRTTVEGTYIVEQEDDSNSVRRFARTDVEEMVDAVLYGIKGTKFANTYARDVMRVILKDAENEVVLVGLVDGKPNFLNMISLSRVG